MGSCRCFSVGDGMNLFIKYGVYSLLGIGDRYYGLRGSTFVEFNPETFAEINTASPLPNPSGVGGAGNKLFAAGTNASSHPQRYELNPDTLAVISTFTITTNTNTTSTGTGGGNQRAVHAVKLPNFTQYIQEYNLSTLALIRQTNVDSTQPNIAGMGGTGEGRYYFYESTNDNIREFNIDTWSILNSRSYSANNLGIGGGREDLYRSNASGANSIFRMNTDTLADIQTISVSNNYRDFGGIKR